MTEAPSGLTDFDLSGLNIEATLLDLEAYELEEDFYEFFKAAWPHVESCGYIDNWHIAAICDHLQAVTEGDIKQLMINVPPRESKSTLVSICWPAWIWARRTRTYLSGPQVKFLVGSYGHTLGLKMSDDMRRLLLSDWYQARWGEQVRLRKEAKAKAAYETTGGGRRQISSPGSSLLGLGGDIIIVDDPSDTQGVESDADRETTINWWKELSSTRRNNPKESPTVIVMQRLREDDVCGTVLDSPEAGEWVHLCLPAKYDPARHCVTYINGHQYFSDPRTKAGQVLDPMRFPKEELDKIEQTLGPYLASGRLQQSPQPKGGGILKATYWRQWPPVDWPLDENGKIKWPAFDLVVASLDGAFSEKEESDFSALTIWGVWRSYANVEPITTIHFDEYGIPVIPYQDKSKLMLIWGWQRRLELHGVPLERPERMSVREWAELNDWPSEWLDRLTREQLDSSYGVSPRDWDDPRGIWHQFRREKWGLVEHVAYDCMRTRVSRLLIENKATGRPVATELQRLYRSEPWSVELVNPKGDKVARAIRSQALLAAGAVHAPTDKAWCASIINSCAQFPRGKHDDVVDSTTQALNYFRETGIELMPHEIEDEWIEERKYRGTRKALYDT